MNCPYCSKDLNPGRGLYMERGEFDNATYTYEEEGQIESWECECGAEIAVVRGPRMEVTQSA